MGYNNEETGNLSKEVHLENSPIEKGDNYAEEEIIRLRKDKLLKLFNNKTNWVVGIILAIIAFISFSIRTSNIDKLKDVTTNNWTLGPDLDPFLFLRWAEYIAEHGKLFVLDSMRNVPLGYNTAGEAQLLSYLIVWFFKFLSLLPNFLVSKLPGAPQEISVTYAAILFPAVMFVFTIIAFFFLTKEIFKDSFKEPIYTNAIALIASSFLAVLPIILPRTIAGIPEKESAGFFFIFLSFYFLIKSFKSKDYKFIILNGILAGLSTATLGLIWGGVTFVFMISGLSIFVFFMLGDFNKKHFTSTLSWVLSFMPVMMFFSTRYTVQNFLISASTTPIFVTLILSSLGIFVYPKVKDKTFVKYFREKWNLPKEIILLIYTGIIILIFGFIFLGKERIIGEIVQTYGQLISPLTTTRFIRTVAENSQPYFIDSWKGSFGPTIKSIPVFFWLFVSGSVALFYNMFPKIRKKERILLATSYFIFILGLIFSRYSPNSSLNGESVTSLFVYFGGMALFLGYFFWVYYKSHKNNERHNLKIEFPIVLLFLMFFVSILAARSGVRFVMVLVPPTSILVAYLMVISVKKTLSNENESWRFFFVTISILILFLGIFSAYSFYESIKSQASSFYPSQYNTQWQKAMGWVRENTSENAVFSHWWDYGYWVQSIGKRATVLDGGNAIVYWNHLLGRHVLTAPEDNLGLEFLYTHKTTHLLIDSTDIGKYPAFSSIGSDENYDRFSFIPTFFMDEKSTQEVKEGTLYFYRGSSSLDDDIIFSVNDTEQRIVKENSGIAGNLLFQRTNGEFLQPEILVISNGKQINVPLRYLFVDNKLRDFGSGYEGAIFLMEKVDQNGNSLVSNKRGAAFYLSARTSQSLLVRKYLFQEEGNFKLVHSESYPLVNELRAQGFKVDDFVYFGGNFLGPIKIWEIEYPANMVINEDFLVTEYPNNVLEKV